MTTQSLVPAGKAVYLEFTKPAMTTQVLFMPEGFTSSHAKVPFSMYRRRITTFQPRKTWKLVAGLPSTIGAMDEESLLGFAEPLFTSLRANDWKLCKMPIVVEITAEDLECVRTGKTPYKALGRVWKARKFLGFPVEFIEAPPSSSPAPRPTI